jgi:hypothetical protein
MVLKDLWRVFRDFNAQQVETWERIGLLNRPWEEERLHWARSEEGWVLHGHLPPPGHEHGHGHGHGASVTRSGWCPGLRRPGRTEEPPRAAR